MTTKTQNLIAAALATAALFAAASAQADSDGAAFDRVARSYAPSAESKWHNTLRPEASGDFVAVASGESADRAMNRLVQGYRRPDAKWINALLPAVAGDYVAVAEGSSADEKFMRQIAYYSRAMLDRGGWVNAFVDDGRNGTYATGNALLAVRIGDGLTSRVLV